LTKDKLVAEGVLCERDVVRKHLREQSVNGFVATPSGAKRVPFGRKASSTYMQTTVVRNVAVRDLEKSSIAVW
jgi:hypothetical protein